MPSDDRVRAAFQALAGPAQTFRATLARTADEVALLLRAHSATRETRSARLAAELGPFARGRISVERFGSVFQAPPGVNGGAAEVVRRAHTTLAGLLDRGDDLFRITLDGKTTLHDAVAARLADLGRAFGAARVARDAQVQLPPHRHAAALERFPFARWSRGERRLAPPLVVETRGADLLAAGLAEFLDGCVKLVLVVSGDTPPTPLARLIAPGTYVQQAGAASDLAGLVAWDGPGIAALVPEGCGRFVHDPKAGPSASGRLRIEHLPDPPRKAIDGISVTQQADELALLVSLSQPAGISAGGQAGAAPAPADPAEQLSAWLLAHTDLTP
jgi:hypothetical protein